MPDLSKLYPTTMPLYQKNYDQDLIDTLRKTLAKDAAKGRPKDFEIKVDGLRVVSRTSDIEEFDDFEAAVKPSTKNVSFYIYDGPNTNRNDRHSFDLPAGAAENSTGLGEIDNLIASRLEEMEKEYQIRTLNEKLADTKQQLQEAEEFCEILEQKVKDLETGQQKKQMGIAELAGYVLGGIVKQNPQILAKLPGGEALAGLMAGGPMPQTSPELGAATFEPAAGGLPITEDMQHRISLVEQMQARFTEPQMISVFSIIDELVAHPEKLPIVAQTLNL